MEQDSQHDLFFPIVNSGALMGPFLLTARLFTTGIFVFYSVNEIIRAHGANGLVYLAVAIQLAGAALVALGYQVRFAALMLAVWSVASLLFRASAGLVTGFEVTMLKDLAISAGFLFMFAYGPGPISIDGDGSRGKPGSMGGKSYRSVFAPILDNNLVMGPLLLVGRILSVLVFYVYGTHKFLDTPGTRIYMINHNPHVPTDLVYLAIATQLVAPTLVLLGYKTRYGALALSGFCIIATVLFHSKFGVHAEVEQFVLDFTIAGGLLFMFAYGPGVLSLDAWLCRAKPAKKTNPAIEKGDVSVAG
jgi:putative oxidoreductase